MKAIRTIVATAVIVFALTTAAMAGVQRLGSDTGQGAAAQAQPAAATATGQTGDTVTLSTQQFAALLHAVDDDGALDRTKKSRHQRAVSRTHHQDSTRTHTGSHAGSHEKSRPSQDGQSRSGAGGGETHTATQHTATQTHTQTHDGGGQGGSHGGGHDGGND